MGKTVSNVVAVALGPPRASARPNLKNEPMLLSLVAVQDACRTTHGGTGKTQDSRGASGTPTGPGPGQRSDIIEIQDRLLQFLFARPGELPPSVQESLKKSSCIVEAMKPGRVVLTTAGG